MPFLPGRERRQISGVYSGGCLSFDLTGTLEKNLCAAALSPKNRVPFDLEDRGCCTDDVLRKRD